MTSTEDWNKLMKLSDESNIVMERINKRGAMIADLVKENKSISLSEATQMEIIDGFDMAGDLRRIYLINQEKAKIVSKY